jgi:hypothetical protein
VLEFIAAMAKALAWPAAAVTVAVLFRTQLRTLLSGPARRVKAGPLEIEWDRTVAEAQVELDQPGIPPALTPATTGPVSSELAEVAERSPTAAVMEAHATIERELRQLLTTAGVADAEQRAGAAGLARLGVQHGVVTEETLRAVEGLSVLRNLAAHGRAGEVTVERAVDYLALADAVLYAIRNKPR